MQFLIVVSGYPSTCCKYVQRVQTERERDREHCAFNIIVFAQNGIILAYFIFNGKTNKLLFPSSNFAFFFSFS